jgi:hypothetical protein
MDGTHAEIRAWTSGHPSQTDNYLDTKCTPRFTSSVRCRSGKNTQQARALDGPNSITPCLLLKFFLC